MQTLHLGIVDLLKNVLEGLLQVPLHLALGDACCLVLQVRQFLSLNFPLLHDLLQHLHILFQLPFLVNETPDHHVLSEGVTLLDCLLLGLVYHLLNKRALAFASRGQGPPARVDVLD